MTEATPTILDRLDIAIKFANYRSQVVSAEMMQDAKTEITRLQAELCKHERGEDEGYQATLCKLGKAEAEIERLQGRVKVLEDELNKIMIGGNHLGLIIGVDHPLYTASFNEAREHYLDRGRYEEYEAWCCWKNIMEARAVLLSEGK